MSDYRPWESEGITEVEHYKKQYIESRRQTALLETRLLELQKEVAQLAIESVNREKTLARLEEEVRQALTEI